MVHPTQGSFGCRTPQCGRVFAGWRKRNAHEARCSSACAECNVSFHSKWKAFDHLHEHETGLGHRCRFGCDAAVPGTFAERTDSTVDRGFLWFPSAGSVHLHHVVDHGATFAQAAAALQLPKNYDDVVPVPLLPVQERIDALAELRASLADSARLRRALEDDTCRERRRSVAKAYKAGLMSVLRENPRALAEYREKVRIWDARTYANIKNDPARYGRRLEKARGADHRRRAEEEDDHRSLRLKRKAAGEADRRARWSPDKRESTNAAKRVAVKYAGETEAEREARVAPRRVKEDETPEEAEARKAKRKEAADARWSRITEDERETIREGRRASNRRYKAKKKRTG